MLESTGCAKLLGIYLSDWVQGEVRCAAGQIGKGGRARLSPSCAKTLRSLAGGGLAKKVGEKKERDANSKTSIFKM